MGEWGTRCFACECGRIANDEGGTSSQDENGLKAAPMLEFIPEDHDRDCADFPNTI
jgi:hypothetical protein